MMKILLFCITTLMLYACATPVELYASGGSKADGIVELSYSHQGFQVPVIDENQALSVAIKRCKAWGYKNAEAFQGGTSVCTSRDLLTPQCISYSSTRKYQCF